MIRPIDLQKAREQVALLAKELDIQAPKVRLAPKYKHSFYRIVERTIYLCTASKWWSVEDSILHEFAHHVVHMRYARRCKSHHGPEFKAAMIQVVRAWYGENTDRYEWEKEYKSVRHLADIAANRMQPRKREDHHGPL